MVEYVAAIRELFQDDAATFEGEVVEFDDVSLSPTPEQRPEIWIGCYTDGALEAVADLGDGWLPGATPPLEKLESCRESLDAKLVERDRDLDSWPMARLVFVAESVTEARNHARQLAEAKISLQLREGYIEDRTEVLEVEELFPNATSPGHPQTVSMGSSASAMRST